MSEAKKLGRPRIYDPDVALERAMDVFWESSFAATSLDDLGAAMSMSRPSLYGAFGDKEALFLRVVDRFSKEGLNQIRELFNLDESLRTSLATLYEAALSTYLSGERGPRGCLLIGAAAPEATHNSRVRALLGEDLATLDQLFEERLRRAQAQCELASGADVATLSRLAVALLHTLAVRARAGETRETLRRIAEGGVGIICNDTALTGASDSLGGRRTL